MAFKDYSIFKGILGSPWAGTDGLDNFRLVFNSPDFWRVLGNTLTISAYKIVFGFPFPIILALLINEIRNERFKKVTQTIIYLPHFISWVVIVGMMRSILSPTYGIAGSFFELLGRTPVNLLASHAAIRPLVVISDIWKEAGWGTIVYLAAISTVNPELYESAIIDGANRFRRMIHITLPSISGVVIMLLILRIGGFMDAGFEQIFVMQNDYTRPFIDIFGTFVYRRGITMGRYSFAAAVGLFNSVVALVLITGANTFAKAIGEEGLL